MGPDSAGWPGRPSGAGRRTSRASPGAPPLTLQRRPDRPGRDAVDADALGPELLGQRFDEVHRRRLGLGIVVEVGRRIIGLLGRGSDDRGTRLQVRQCRLDNPERRVNVGLHGGVEVLDRNLDDEFPSAGGRRCLPVYPGRRVRHRLVDQVPAESRRGDRPEWPPPSGPPGWISAITSRASGSSAENS